MESLHIYLKHNLFIVFLFLLSVNSVVAQQEYLYHFYEWTAHHRELNAGFINNKGEVVIQPQFEDTKEFNEGLAPVKSRKNHKWGYINTKGQVEIPFIYDFAEEFNHGVAVVGYYDPTVESSIVGDNPEYKPRQLT